MPGDKRRVFLALWPDEATRNQLERLSRRLSGPGRSVPSAHLHLTLAFIGVVTSAQVACLAGRIDALRLRPLALNLDRIGHFDRARVTWVGPSHPPDRLMLLARQAHDLCRDCDIAIRTQPFHPHVTLRRFARSPAHTLDFSSIQWSADRVVLIESGRNGAPGAYRILAETKPAI